MDTSKSYKNFREALQTSTPPCIPHLGVFLTDLTFIEQGNPDVVQENLINFKKQQLVYDVITKIKQFQIEGYNFALVPELQTVLSLETYEIVADNVLFDHSLRIEPRGWAGPDK